MPQLSAFITPEQRRKLESHPIEPQPLKTELLAILQKAADAGQYGNPVRARQHALHAMQLIKDRL